MKSFSITTVKAYTPRWIKRDFIVFSEDYKRIRQNFPYQGYSCFRCKRNFQLGETIALAAFTSEGNKVLCQKCADELI